jgi:hypothetical protein
VAWVKGQSGSNPSGRLKEKAAMNAGAGSVKFSLSLFAA